MRCEMARKSIVAGLLILTILALPAGRAAADAAETTGSLCVYIYPEAAAGAGAQWRRLGTTAWFDSGATETGIAAGSIKIEFKHITGWCPDFFDGLSETVVAGQIRPVTGFYSQTGTARVTITPPEAVAAGVQWRLAGRTQWHDSGTSDSEAIVGDSLLEFKATPSYSIAMISTVKVAAGKVSDVTAVCAPTLAGLSWGSYLGGSSDDNILGMAVDGEDNIYVTGGTTLGGEWVSGGYLTNLGGQSSDVFVSKFSPDGLPFWSSLLGGHLEDYGKGIAVDGAGNIFICGVTKSSDWIAGGYDTAFHGGYDGFLYKLSAAGQPLWGTYIGGLGDEDAVGVDLDSAGNPYVTGSTSSSGWTSGVTSSTLNGYRDAYLVKVSPAGQHVWSTTLGGGRR